MGYFSELDISMEERNAQKIDRSYPSPYEQLEYHLEDLIARLDILNERRPHDSMHPCYDRYFYASFGAVDAEYPDTVQGLVAAINETTKQIHKLQRKQKLYIRLQKALAEAGATPDGQLVVTSLFLPLCFPVLSA